MGEKVMPKTGKWFEWKDFSPSGFKKMSGKRFLKMKDGRYLVWRKK
tara:strand:+ start:5740 stop:5877 length:138 start_codon:yes stop_codon:yes gene_type:complete